MAKIKKEDAYKPYDHVTTTFNVRRLANDTKSVFKSNFKGQLHPSIDLDELYELVQKEAIKRGYKEKPKTKKNEEGPGSSKEISES